jgi:hypothetical protein
VPYQDGIRTSLGDAPIAPGAHGELQGRILAPDIPGVYWLQWDMVEEGVTWFAQVAPRQPRTMVIVLPPPVWMFAPLPLLIACWGLYALRERNAAGLKPRATADRAHLRKAQRRSPVCGAGLQPCDPGVPWCVATLAVAVDPRTSPCWSDQVA